MDILVPNVGSMATRLRANLAKGIDNDNECYVFIQSSPLPMYQG